MITDPWFYALAAPAVILLGLAKGGFGGIGVIAVPLMALAVSPVLAASITLPILIVQDVVSVWAFRKTWDRAILMLMLPSAAVGIFVGFALAAFVRPGAVELAVGAVSVVFAVQRLWLERTGAPVREARVEGLPWRGVLAGIAAGFTSQISHAGGPPFQMYVLPKQLARDVFIGTSAIFFAAVNWMKVPAYLALGQFTHESLATSVALLPLAVASTWAGVWLVRRVPGRAFYRIIYGLLIAVGGKLAWDGAVSLFA
ncbi:MAG: sulfite exporter TauE/SafE family protein [Phenylobacterium sp.]|uniref:sulfite exporter TauE/SafE family protein n=1 Tax=Phenylobacterium sp. TaxID=1871053 RepID=UPI001B633118|nr:sulfite exporter TauE/SafE family protein [Phenylobacterium sp.]MBP7816935.1 sulfite exporter TauE/SafE family protein [Phenylobacterium sp.]MBP9231910.1 sulfite exporter TauE/SafE family protein [Phenylobacterium sp.]